MSHDSPTRIDRILPDLFAELANPRTPDYLEDAIERASSRSQRPAWTYPGRWLPVEITTKAAPSARVPWRQLGILTLIQLLLATAAVVFVGSRPRVPAPFGLAGNGAVAFERDGDIVAADPVSGTITPIVSGPEVDSDPEYSPDGTRIAFRRAAGIATSSMLMVANADGSGLAAATPEPFEALQSWLFSPSGKELLVTALVDGVSQMSIVTIDGSAPPRPIEIALPRDPEDSAFRPPDGREILVFLAVGRATRGLFAVDVTTGLSRPVVPAPADADLFGGAWSPAGDRISYHRFPNVGDGPRARTWIVDADGTNDHQLDVGRTSAYDFAMTGFSNDGTRILILSGPTADGGGERLVVVSVDGVGAPVELQCGGSEDNACADAWIWSPDDAALLGTHTETDGAVTYVIADPVTGAVSPASWTDGGVPTWQRSAPSEP